MHVNSNIVVTVFVSDNGMLMLILILIFTRILRADWLKPFHEETGLPPREYNVLIGQNLVTFRPDMRLKMVDFFSKFKASKTIKYLYSVR